MGFLSHKVIKRIDANVFFLSRYFPLIMKPIYQMDISFLTLPHFYFVWFSFEKDFSDRENAPRPKIFFFFSFFFFFVSVSFDCVVVVCKVVLKLWLVYVCNSDSN